MIPVYPTLVRNGYPMIRPCHQTHPSPSHGQPDRHPDRNHPFFGLPLRTETVLAGGFELFLQLYILSFQGFTRVALFLKKG